MDVCYYPGCSLKTAAANFETSALASIEKLGHRLHELSDWNCCGTVSSLASDDLMHHVASVRNLIRVSETGSDEVVTLCAMCYNTLKQANRSMEEDPEKRATINNFMDTEEDYHGDIKVLHLLEFLRDEIGFDEINKKVTRPLHGLKIATYYGCLLLRPSGMEIDTPEDPTIIEELIEALGGEVIVSPFRIECCGSYNTVDNIGPVIERTKMILEDCRKRGADAVVVSCPLCFFNLDYRQKALREKERGFEPFPIFYFTQLLAVALDVEEGKLGLDKHFVDPKKILQESGVLKDKYLGDYME